MQDSREIIVRAAEAVRTRRWARAEEIICQALGPWADEDTVKRILGHLFLISNREGALSFHLLRAEELLVSRLRENIGRGFVPASSSDASNYEFDAFDLEDLEVVEWHASIESSVFSGRNELSDKKPFGTKDKAVLPDSEPELELGSESVIVTDAPALIVEPGAGKAGGLADGDSAPVNEIGTGEKDTEREGAQESAWSCDKDDGCSKSMADRIESTSTGKEGSAVDEGSMVKRPIIDREQMYRTLAESLGDVRDGYEEDPESFTYVPWEEEIEEEILEPLPEEERKDSDSENLEPLDAVYEDDIGEDLFFDGSDLADQKSQWDATILDFDDFREDRNTEKPMGALPDRVSIVEQGRKKAVELIFELDWPRDLLPLLTAALSCKGWSRRYRAIVELHNLGLGPDEFPHVWHLRNYWQSTPKFWMSFERISLNVRHQQTSDRYSVLSWPEAFKIVRSFYGGVSEEELDLFLETAFDAWYGNRRLRAQFRAFIWFVKDCVERLSDGLSASVLLASLESGSNTPDGYAGSEQRC
jgi:hypothetical protein